MEARLARLCGHVGGVDAGDGRGGWAFVQVVDKVADAVLGALSLALDLEAVSGTTGAAPFGGCG